MQPAFEQVDIAPPYLAQIAELVRFSELNSLYAEPDVFGLEEASNAQGPVLSHLSRTEKVGIVKYKIPQTLYINDRVNFVGNVLRTSPAPGVSEPIKELI